jgi:hypothetical protein
MPTPDSSPPLASCRSACAGSLILLLSTVPEAIPETVLSRCVETTLQQSARQKPSAEELAVLKALEECFVIETRPGPATAFRLARSLQEILSQIRERIASDYENILRKETARYKQASEDAYWLKGRTAQIRALVEAGALRERERVLQAVFDALGEALRAQHGFPAENPVVRALAEKFTTPDLLRGLDILESLRRRLALGVQESLAFECGFLEMINIHETAQSAVSKP